MSDAPRHCTDPDIHGPHQYGGDEAMLHCPGSGLRDRIADALERAIAEPAVSPPTARGIADELADAVMGVVGPEITRVALELTSGYEIGYRQQQKQLMDADEQADDLRAELAKARADLDAATQFGFPNGVTVSRQWDGGWRVAWPNPEAPGDWRCFHPMTADEGDIDAALARARQLAEGAPVDGG